jgi:hypothetical protein
MSTCRFDDVEELFFRIKPDFVGEMKSVSDDAKRAVFVPGDIAIGEIGPQRVHPVLQPRRHGDPNAVLRIAQDEIGFTYRSPVDAIGEHFRTAIARHQLEPIGAKVRDQDVAAASERETIGQRALEVAAGFRRRVLEVIGMRLGNQLLTAIGDSNHPSARVGRPERAVRFGEDALGTLQAAADITQRALVDAEIQDRVPGHFAVTFSGSAKAT